MFDTSSDRSPKGFALRILAVLCLSLGVMAGQPAQADNSCTWAFDNDCDEPGIGTGLCAAFTDDADCRPTGGGGGGPNSCQWAFDNDCDEPGIGTGLCAAGTDTADCTAPAPAGPNSCQWAFDNDCDEPGIGTGLCAAGTDTADCTVPGVPGLNSCAFAFDNECDEPDGTGLCAAGTDDADCTAFPPNACQWAFDNECDEPGIGTGLCAAGTDTADCRTSTAPPRTSIPSTQQGIQIQTALNFFGFNAGVVDGQIGPGSRAAIERFQRAMGYPVNGRNLAPDQFGFLTGAYTWATAQGGAAQTGLRGAALMQAYRNLLQGTTTVRPVPTTPVQPRNPGRQGTRGTSLTCPSPQNSDGFELYYDGYSAQYFIDTDGSTGEWVNADDGSYAFDTYYHPLGLMLESWESDQRGNEIPGSRQTVAYQGSPTPIPMPASGVVWTGTETASFSSGGATEVFTTNVQVQPGFVETIGTCSYNFLPILVSRTNRASGDTYQELYVNFVEFGVTVYAGSSTPGFPPEEVVPLGIGIRADDGIGP